jgi:hypothetical protein
VTVTRTGPKTDGSETEIEGLLHTVTRKRRRIKIVIETETEIIGEIETETEVMISYVEE